MILLSLPRIITVAIALLRVVKNTADTIYTYTQLW